MAAAQARDGGSKFASELSPLKKLDVKFARKGAAEALKAFKKAPLNLPAGGKYILKKDGSALHIYETTQGISKLDFTDQKFGGETEFGSGTITLSFRGGGSIASIVLHTEKAKDDPDAVQEKALPVLRQIDEFKKLSSKTYARPDDPQIGIDKARMAELVKEIQAAYAEKEEEPDEPTLPEPDPDDEPVRTTRRRSSSSTPSRPTRTSRPSPPPSTPAPRPRPVSRPTRSSEGSSSFSRSSG